MEWLCRMYRMWASFAQFLPANQLCGMCKSINKQTVLPLLGDKKSLFNVGVSWDVSSVKQMCYRCLDEWMDMRLDTWAGRVDNPFSRNMLLYNASLWGVVPTAVWRVSSSCHWVLCMVSGHRLRPERRPVAFRRAELWSRPSEHHGGQGRRSHRSHKHPAPSHHRHTALLWWWVDMLHSCGLQLCSDALPV